MTSYINKATNNFVNLSPEQQDYFKQKARQEAQELLKKYASTPTYAHLVALEFSKAVSKLYEETLRNRQASSTQSTSSQEDREELTQMEWFR
jgi:hypothetical protein